MDASVDARFTAIEKAVLEWFVQEYKDENLTAQIRAAKLAKREYTGVGLFVDLDVSPTLVPVDLAKVLMNETYRNTGKKIPPSWPIRGPTLESTDIELGGDAILWGKHGYIKQLEMYAFGEFFREEIRQFKLGDKIPVTDARKIVSH